MNILDPQACYSAPMSPAASVSDRVPLGSSVAAQIRDQILSGLLPPGTRIRQEELAKQVGTSRIPVREALRELESEGLVVLAPSVGATVSRLTVAEFTELYRIREAIEPVLAAESAQHRTEELMRRLEETADQIEQSVADPRRWLELDRRLHLASFTCAEMPQARVIVETLWNQTQQYRRAYLMSLEPSLFEFAHSEHRLILDGFRRRDGDGAALSHRLHLRRTRLALAEHPELFAD